MIYSCSIIGASAAYNDLDKWGGSRPLGGGGGRLSNEGGEFIFLSRLTTTRVSTLKVQLIKYLNLKEE